MAGKRVGSLFLVTLLFGVILSSGVEARRLNQASITIDTVDGRQRGSVGIDGDETFATSASTGTTRASSAARISTSPSGQTAQTGAVGDDADGNFQGVAAGIRSPSRPSGVGSAGRTPPLSAPSSPGASVSVGGSGSASVGGSGSTSVIISGGGRTSETEEDMDDMEAEAPATVIPTEDIEDVEETPEEVPEPQTKPVEVEEEEEVVPQVAPAPVPTVAESIVFEESAEDEEEATVAAPIVEESTTEVVIAPAMVPITTDAGREQEVAVDGKSGRRICLTSDTSMLEELLNEGYEVTILTPTRLGYEISMMVRSGYATSDTTFFFDHVPEDVQELCNYDPDTAPVPAKHVENQPDAMEADRILRDLCASSTVLYVPNLLNTCWDAGYVTFLDLAVLG